MKTKKTKRKTIRGIIGLALLSVGIIMVVPPPDIEILFITGLTIAGVPLAYSIVIVYLFGFLMILIGSFLAGKKIKDVLNRKKLNKQKSEV